MTFFAPQKRHGDFWPKEIPVWSTEMCFDVLSFVAFSGECIVRGIEWNHFSLNSVQITCYFGYRTFSVHSHLWKQNYQEFLLNCIGIWYVFMSNTKSISNLVCSSFYHDLDAWSFWDQIQNSLHVCIYESVRFCLYHITQTLGCSPFSQHSLNRWRSDL